MLLFLTFSMCLVLVADSMTQNRYQKSKIQRFSVASDKLLPILFSSTQLLLRLGNGAFTQGYNVALEKDEAESDTYSILRLLGYKVAESNAVPARDNKMEPIILYEFEGCPYCKKVREALVLLDIDALFLPTPKGSPNFRVEAKNLGGKTQFPFMIDPNNNDIQMYESDKIIEYLYEKYGKGLEIPKSLQNSVVNTLSLATSSLFRFNKGVTYVEAKPVSKEKPLTLYGYEASPFCKIVRERLVELELPHIQRTCGRGSSKRDELFMKTGRFQVPYLEDPNTDVKLFESADILDYLNEVYAV